MWKFGNRAAEIVDVQGNPSSAFDQEAIFGPFLTVAVLTMVVWFYMYSKRIPFLTAYIEKRGQDFKPEDMTAELLAKISPPSVSNPSDNLKNLCEMPIVFYAICCHLFVTQQVDQIYLYTAWSFAIFRVLHSAVHCTFNKTIGFQPLSFKLFDAVSIC